MNILRSVAMAFSMFSRIPAPKVAWKEQNMRYMLAAMPLVGAVVGLVLWGWVWLCALLDFGVWLRAAGLTLVPVAVTGGIHLDGYADTVDALASRAPTEKKREILKDPHTGAFAVVGLCAYFLLYFALAAELDVSPRTALTLGLIHCFSRALGGLAVLALPSAGAGGLSDTFRQASGRTATALLALELLALVAAMVATTGAQGIAALCAAGLLFLYLMVMSKRQFGGMSGDLAGFLIQLAELAMLAAVILAQRGAAIWF